MICVYNVVYIAVIFKLFFIRKVDCIYHKYYFDLSLDSSRGGFLPRCALHVCPYLAGFHGLSSKPVCYGWRYLAQFYGIVKVVKHGTCR